MREDNFYRRQSVPQMIPKDQEDALERERQQVLDDHPVIQEVIESLRERIEFYKSIDAIPTEITVHPDEFMHVVAANKLTVSNLETEAVRLEELITQHLKR